MAMVITDKIKSGIITGPPLSNNCIAAKTLSISSYTPYPHALQTEGPAGSALNFDI